MLQFFFNLMARLARSFENAKALQAAGEDPLSDPAIRRMDERQLADLPFERGVSCG